MYGMQVYITPEDVIERMSDEDKERFNQCVFTDVVKERDGSVTITCLVFKDQDPYVESQQRKKLFNGETPSVEDWKKLGYTDEEAKILAEASKVYKHRV